MLNRRAAAVALAGVLVVTATGCSRSPASKPSADQQAAQTYLDALGKAEAATAASTTSDPARAKTEIAASLAGLGAGVRASFRITGVTDRTDTRSTVDYDASWRIPGTSAPWAYSGSLPMTKATTGWTVQWASSDIAPGLSAGDHLSLQRSQPVRAELLDSSGKPLFTEQPVVVVGINPAHVTDLTSLAATLASVLKVSASDIVTSVKAASPTQFVPVITLRQAAYEKVRARIHDLPGTQFQTTTELLGPTTTFAQPLLGQVGPATQQLITASDGAVQAGDQAGLSGLQLAFNTQLAGTVGLAVYATPDAATPDAAGSTGTKLADIAAAKPGAAVQLTLDRATQTAAEKALADVTAPASIVVTQPSTGAILAVANTPATNGIDIGLDGEYPPGSTFKIVTYAAAFTADSALTPATPLDCPATITVNGQTVRNENNFDKGTIPASSAFAFSCNTTAATLGLKLPPDALLKAAQALGLGQKWNLPVDTFSGSLPEPSGASAQNEQAADAYGQGQVLVSPLLMSEIAGAASTGHSVAPSLLAGRPATPGPAHSAKVTGYLNTLMRDVVTVPGATGHALADLPGNIEGKTGTAEFGKAVPAQSHSWFAGIRGDLAFSVFIYGGGDSDATTGAVSVARTFLTALGPNSH